jgi:glucose dehydrogenase
MELRHDAESQRRWRVLDSYSLDPKTGEVFAGIANPWPDFNRDIDNTTDDEGDEKYTAKTDSVVSINAMNIPKAELNCRAFGKEFGGYVWKDWSVAAKQQGPRGWITAMDGETGRVIWRYHTESQVNAGLVPTKSALLFAGR